MTTTEVPKFCAGRAHSHCTAGHPVHRNDLPVRDTDLPQRWSHCRTVDFMFCDAPIAFDPVLICAEHISASKAEMAAELIRQYSDRTGPAAGDPFDADLWMDEAAELLTALIP